MHATLPDLRGSLFKLGAPQGLDLCHIEEVEPVLVPKAIPRRHRAVAVMPVLAGYIRQTVRILARMTEGWRIVLRI